MGTPQNHLKNFGITNHVSDDEIKLTKELLHLYGPLVSQSVQRMDECTEECYQSRRQTVSDFINLAIDCDHDRYSRQIADRLAETDRSMYLLSLLEQALNIVKGNPQNGERYYNMLHARYFDCNCKTNEDAFLKIGISSSTYYRYIHDAEKYLAAVLWWNVIPNVIKHAIDDHPHDKDT